MSIHTMVDLETLGTGNDALILSIGAVKFDADEILDRFHVGIDPEDAERYGLKISASTMLWWLEPEREPGRHALLTLYKHSKVDLFSALDGFAQWQAATTIGEPLGSLWGNGALFDNAILRHAYAKTGVDYPVHFTQDACYRTLKNRAPEIKLERIGVHHSAIDDAESQARHLQTICKYFGIVL